MRRLLVLLTAFALLFAACGDDGGSSDDGGTDGQTTEPQSTDGAGTDAGDTSPNDAALDAKLLTAADLGGEWTEDEGSRVVTEDDGSDGPECLQDPPDDPDHDKATVAFTFDKDNAGFPTLKQQLTDYGDEDAIADAFSTAAAAIDSCGDFTYGPEGSEVDGSVEEIDGPDVGDESRTWKMTLSTQGFDFTAYIFYARLGETGLSLYYLDQTTPDLAAFGELIDESVAKL
jgi:hypothetical protein